MTQAPAPSRAASGAPSRPRLPLWLAPWVAGLGFGLAYGITQRLASVNVGELIRFGQGFDVQVFPGTSLESLRLRFGADAAELRGNLELQQLERQQDPDADQAPAPTAAPEEPDGLAGDPALEPTADELPEQNAEPPAPPAPRP